MDSAGPEQYEKQNLYERITDVAKKVFSEITSRELQEGSLIKQLKGMPLNPLDLRQRIIDDIAERLNLPYLREMPRTTEKMYDVFLQLLLEGIEADVYSLVDM